MKKIGIVTIDGDNNYGNRLQNYALEQSIKSLGFEVETLVFPKKKEIRDIVRTVVKLRKKEFRIQRQKSAKMENLKSKGFKIFREKYLQNKEYKREDDFSGFDRFVTGSDQVWNPSWRLQDDYWLRFVPKEKRFSYAASMATTEVHQANIKKLPLYLMEMNEIAVREEESIEFIKNISNRDAKWVLDPTMLLTKSDYEKLIDEQTDSQVDASAPYILIYTLTGVQNNLKKKLIDYADKNKLKIRYIMGNEYHPEHMVYDPVEFIEAIQKAKFVVSDSFHCGVYSILMETDFILFDRIDGENMSSRITSLLSKLEIESQFYSDNKEIDEMLNVDFEKTSKKIELLRSESKDYLNYILNKEI